MSVGMVCVFAVFSALWIFGLIDALQSDESMMRYLVLSLAVIAVGVFQLTRRKKQ